MSTAQPRITIMGEEVPWDSLPEAGATELADYFKPVKLSARAINNASKIVPSEHWIKFGLHTWLSARADRVFSKLTSDQTKGRMGLMNYIFGFDADGPVLLDVYI